VNTADIVVIAVMAIGLVVWVGEPLVRRGRMQEAAADAQGDAIERLTLQKETLYTAIRDLDFDHQTGKVDAEDHAELRGQMEAEAADILRQLDLVDPLADLDLVAEQEILAYRQKEDAAALATEDTCPACGTGLTADPTYCPICGQSLKPAV
jgi:rubrerythrin